MVRELFVLMWVEDVQQEAIDAKVKLFLRELESARPSRAPQDVLFVEPLPPSFDVAPLQKFIASSDIDNIAVFCANTAGTEHEYFARLWDLAFAAGKKTNMPSPQVNVGVQTTTSSTVSTCDAGTQVTVNDSATPPHLDA